MIHETIALWDKHPEATLTSYCITSTDELKLSPRRAVVVCPGGGYHFLSDREAEPIVFKFLSAGFNVFLLRYSIKPNAHSYAPLIEAGMAIKYIRENAEKYNTDPNYVFIGGFSAGGHLAASAGTLWNIKPVREALGIESGNAPEGINRPTGTILSYPVISGGEYAHRGSFNNILSERKDDPEAIAELSLENRVSADTVPAFIWSTRPDTTVPVQNSLLFALALADHDIPFEMHIYPKGGHGASLGNAIVGSGLHSISGWIDDSIRWMNGITVKP